MSTSLPDSQPAYEAAHHSAAFYPVPLPGCIRISGVDRETFLQRQTTNDIRTLNQGSAQLSVLTSPAARILDVFYLVVDGENLIAISLPGRGAKTATYLKSRIFFMDKVTVQDESSAVHQIDVLGPQAPDALARLGMPVPAEEMGVTATRFGGESLSVLKHSRSFGLGYRLLVPAQAAMELVAALAANDLLELTASEFDLLRIEAGLPAADRELTEEYTPLEASLGAAISDSKGCYTGQEVIARQITYDKVTQHLCGLRLDGEAITGQQIWSSDRSVGTLRSVGQSPRFGWIGLAILKRPHDQPDVQLIVGDREETGQNVRVEALPFK